MTFLTLTSRCDAWLREGWRGGCRGCIERPSYIHLSPPTPSLSWPFLSPASLFPSFPPDIRGLPPLPPPVPNLLYLFHLLLLLRLCLPPRPLHPSFATRLPKPALSSAALSRRAPFSFSADSTLPRFPFLFPSFPSRRGAAWRGRPVHALATRASATKTLPPDKQTADTSQFYAIVSSSVCLAVERVATRRISLRAG